MAVEPDTRQEAGDRPGAAEHAPSSILGNPYLLLALASLFWSGNHIVGRAISGEVPPIGLSTVRWLVPALLLWPFARPHLKRDWPLMRAHGGIMLWLGFTGGALFSALQYVGLQYTTAVNVSVLNSLVPVLILAAGAMIFGDRVRRAQVAGIAISLAGVLVVIAKGSLDTFLTLSFNWADLLIVFNMATFAIYAACLRLRPPIHWLSFMFALSVMSTAMSLPFALWEAAAGATFRPTVLTAVALGYVAIFPSVFAFAAWNRGVEVIGAGRAGPFLHLIPIFTAVLSITLLGEPLFAFHLIGFGTILLGVWLAASGGPRVASGPGRLR